MNGEQVGTTYEAMGLQQLAEEAVNAAEAAVRNSRAAVVQTVNAGRMLIAAKAKVGHGNFGDWLEENWVSESRSKRTAQGYMEVVRQVDALGADVSSFESVADIQRQFKCASLAHLPDEGPKIAKLAHSTEVEPTPAANLTHADIPEPEPQLCSPAPEEPGPDPEPIEPPAEPVVSTSTLSGDSITDPPVVRWDQIGVDFPQIEYAFAAILRLPMDESECRKMVKLVSDLLRKLKQLLPEDERPAA